MSSRGHLLIPIVVLVAACSASPTPMPSSIAQQRTCGRLTTSTCLQVIATVEATDPAAASSSLAIADYALPPGPLAASSGGDAFDYLVAFAPWAPQASQGPYLSPPMWQVTEAGSAWSAKPVYVTDVSVCFIILLRDVSLTDYAPSFPSGVCAPSPSSAITPSPSAVASAVPTDVPALTVADPRVVVTPSRGLHDGQTVVVTVTGFSVGGKQWVSECSSKAVATDLGCGSELAAQTLLVTDDGRTGSAQFTVSSRAYDQPLGGTLHRCTDQCVIVVSLGGGFAFVSAPIVFGP